MVCKHSILKKCPPVTGKSMEVFMNLVKVELMFIYLV